MTRTKKALISLLPLRRELSFTNKTWLLSSLFSLSLHVGLTNGMFYDCLDDDTASRVCTANTCFDEPSTYCSCRVVNYTTVNTNFEDCKYNCCAGYYNCDSANQRCVFDLAGGYPRSKCLKTCPGAAKGYQCDLQKGQCVLSTRPGAVSESDCNANCGRNTVLLCVYQCESWVLQKCITKDPNQPGLICPNQAGGIEAGDDSHCIPDGGMCLDVQWKCCGDSKCDLSSGVCTPQSGPPKRQSLTCPDSKNEPAKFLGSSADVNIGICKDYDCIYQGSPCYPAQCPSVAGEANVCSPTDLRNMHNLDQIELRVRPEPSPAFLPSLLNPTNLASNKKNADGSTKLFASTHRAQHTARWKDPASFKMVSLDYNVIHAKDVLLLSGLSVVVGVDCLPDGRMLLWLNSVEPAVVGDIAPVVAALREKPLLSGGHEWECAFPADGADAHVKVEAPTKWTVKTIQRRVLDVGDVKVSGPHVIVELHTRAASTAEFYQTAHISFQTTAFPKQVHMHDASTEPKHRAAFGAYRASFSPKGDGSEREDQYGFWPFSAITKVVDDLKGLAEKAADIVKKIWHTSVAIATGTVDYDDTSQLASINWNYDENAAGQANRSNWVIDASVTCVACFLDLEVGLHLDLHVHEFSLVSAAAWIEGQVTSHVDATVTGEAHTHRSYDTVLAVVNIPDITIVVGEIPFVLKVTIPVHGGYVFDFDAYGTLHAQATMVGHAKYGFQYFPHDTSATGGFQFIHTHSFSHDGKVVKASAQINSQVDVYIMPLVDVAIDHIGGPNIGIKAFVEPVVQFKSASPCSATWGPASTFTLNWGLQLTIGAFIDISLGSAHIYNHQWGPSQIFNLKWPLASGCIQAQAHTPPLDKKSINGTLGVVAPHYMGDKLHLFDGVAYAGQVTISSLPACDRYLSIPVHFQLMNSTGEDSKGFPVWTSNEPHNWNRTSTLASTGVNVGCVAQATYVADYGVFEVFATPPGQPSIDYKNCTLDAIKQGYTIASLSGKYTLSPDLATVTINTNTQCIGTVTLTRQLHERGKTRRLSVNSPGYTWG